MILAQAGDFPHIVHVAPNSRMSRDGCWLEAAQMMLKLDAYAYVRYFSVGHPSLPGDMHL